MYHLRRKTLINSCDDFNYLDGHPVVAQQPPQYLSAGAIESLLGIYKVDVQGGLPFNALFHSNPQHCYLVRAASASSKPRLLLSQLSIQCGLDMLTLDMITLQNTLVTMFKSTMSRQFFQWLRSPFFGSLIGKPFFHPSGTCSLLHIWLKRSKRTSSDTSRPAFNCLWRYIVTSWCLPVL